MCTALARIRTSAAYRSRPMRDLPVSITSAMLLRLAREGVLRSDPCRDVPDGEHAPDECVLSGGVRGPIVGELPRERLLQHIVRLPGRSVRAKLVAKTQV